MSFNPIDVHVGSQVKIRRKSLRMTQQQLAEVLGLTFQQIQKYERGANRISASKLMLIAETLEAPISFFFDGLDGTGGSPTRAFSEDEAKYDPSTTKQVLDFVSSEEGTELNRAFAAIQDPATRKQLVTLFETIAKREED